MDPSCVDLHTTQHQGVQSWTSSLWNLAELLGLSNLLPKRRTTVDTLRSFVNYFDTTDLPSIEDAELKYLCIKEGESTYLEDNYPDDPDTLVGVANFTKHFASLKTQPTKMAEHFANILAEAPQLFGDVAADFIVQAGLSGMSEAYTMFIFPKDLSYNLYVQALPLVGEVINFMNDITSFYKEECENERHNLVSLMAEARGEPKIETLCYLVERCIQAHERTLRILSPYEGVRSNYENFVKGYLAFHLGAKRYRLSELDL
ncbi:hypothetical protein IW261DRAFT_1595634 [Armillaria novae-zelandiae]|uniref:Terpenoid synthase n=1 Tax=Armillaria novae-zelandiae TaxID=153914 RepID=A0AA39P0A4_9AGAR|nr:hypothetical protein IW261DRAFT_1595634 [Armillaria novae-zelandiae]